MSDAAPEPPATDRPQSPTPAPIFSGRRSAMAICVATALIGLGLLAITGPFWAPAVIPLLTGGSTSATAERVAQVETAQRDLQQTVEQGLAAVQKNVADTRASLQPLERRIAALESKPAAAASEVAELRQHIKALESNPTATPGDIAVLREQVKTLESRPAPQPPDLGDIRQQLQQLSSANADLNSRIAALEKTEQAQRVSDPVDTALLLTVLRIREALETARPFTAEYDALAALAKTRSDIASAAASLAEPAKSGVVSRAVLIERLRTLGGAIATAEPSPANDGWGARAWSQLRGLVTIRRVEGPGQTGPEQAISTAERSLVAGDLADAIAALSALTGPPAESARAWLQMARQRLAAETALHQLETLLVARLGVAR